MARVVIAKLPRAGNRAGGDNAAVIETKVRDESGRIRTLRRLDGHSKTFGEDLTYVFKKNVAEARRENKRVTGMLDREPAKG